MATNINFAPQSDSFKEYIARIFQSSNINFVLGAGASNPAIQVAGSIENDLQALYNSNQHEAALNLEFQFLRDIQMPNNYLIDSSMPPQPSRPLMSQPQPSRPLVSQPQPSRPLVSQPQPPQSLVPPPPPPVQQPPRFSQPVLNIDSVLAQYQRFLDIIENILRRRKSNILAKKVNIFTTNYDLFIEKASLKFRNIVLNDGFQIRSSLANEYIYDTRSFSRMVYESSNLYEYKVEIPVINLIKMHGSLSWSMDSKKENIVYKAETRNLTPIQSMEQKRSWVDDYYLILPRKEKFKETLLNHTYYDLMRLYSNELDKEQTTLMAFGFSFEDEHILDITKRALRNSTLKLIVFAFDQSAVNNLMAKFQIYSNVDIITPQPENNIKFSEFNQAISCFYQ
jgi:hypothetical protein